MNYQISSDNMDVSESMKVLARQKAERLEKLWVSIPEENKSLRIVMNSLPDDKFLVKIEANLNGEIFYTEEPGFQLETALIDTVEELVRKYKKSKMAKEEVEWEERRESKRVSEDDLRRGSAI